jgi:hypothetical protein
MRQTMFRRRPRSIALATALTAAVASGCGSLFDTRDCTTEFVYGLQVDVVDSLTGAPAGRGAVVIARDGSYADTAKSQLPPGSPAEGQTLLLAGERRGTYEVTVQRPGDQAWRQAGVRVTGDACHVRPTHLTARLARDP